jgi:hypothetical protein
MILFIVQIDDIKPHLGADTLEKLMGVYGKISIGYVGRFLPVCLHHSEDMLANQPLKAPQIPHLRLKLRHYCTETCTLRAKNKKIKFKYYNKLRH